MIATIVDCTWANSPTIEPVASTQKHTSMKPKAGRGRLSLDGALKIVFLRSPIAPLATIETEAGAAEADFDDLAALAGLAGLAALDLLAGFVGILLPATTLFGGRVDNFFLGTRFPKVFTAAVPSAMVIAMVIVLSIFFFLPESKKSCASLTVLSIEDVLVMGLGLAALAFFTIL